MFVIMLFIGMSVLGFIDSVRGPLVPAVLNYFSISYTAFGTILAFSSFAFLLATLTAGYLVPRIGARRSFIAGYVISALGLLVTGMASSPLILAAGLFLIGLAGGYLEITLNGSAGRVFVSRPGFLMNLLHLFFGLGATIGPLVVGNRLAAGLSWHGIYRLVAILPMVALAVAFLLPRKRIIPRDEEVVGSYGVLYLLRDSRVAFTAVALGMFVAMELGVATWLANFLVAARGTDPARAANAVAWFYGVFSASRLLLGWITDRLGFFPVLVGATLLTAAAIVAGVLVPGLTWLLILTGIPVALLFPTVMAHISRVYPGEMEAVMSVSVTVAGIFILFSNFLIGFTHEVLGVNGGFLSIAGFSILGLGALVVARRKEERHGDIRAAKERAD